MNPFSPQHLLPVQNMVSCVVEKVISRDFVRWDPLSSMNRSSDARLGVILSSSVLGETYASSIPLFFGLVEPVQSLGTEMDVFPQVAQPILNIIARSQNPAFQGQCRKVLRASIISPICGVELTFAKVAAEE